MLPRWSTAPLATIVAGGFVAVLLIAPRLVACQDAPPLTNTTCPVLVGEEVDPTKFVDYEGRRIFFCCSKCIRKFEAAPADYLANLPHQPAAPAEHVQQAGAAPGGVPAVPQAEAPPGGGAGHAHPASEPAETRETGHQHGGGHTGAAGREEKGVLAHLVEWLGRFHPMLVHFPIALLMAAALAELLSMSGRLVEARSSARFGIVLAAATAVAAATLGWARASGGGFPASTADAVEVHRWLGTTTAAWLTAAAVCSEVGRRAPRRWMALYRFFLFAGVALVGFTGHFGAVITHGLDYYVW